MRWLAFAALLALAALLVFRGFGATVGHVVQTLAFFVGLVAGLAAGSSAARPFCREDGHTNRTKLVMAWISFSALFALALSLAFLVGLPGGEGVIPELAQGAAWGFAGFFWLTVLLDTLWRTDDRGNAWRFFTWFALVASGSFASVFAAVLVHGYVLLPLSRYAP